MKILYIEPFYGGSHKNWINSYKEKSEKHKIEILSLKGIHWKWRMHGAAITLARQFLLIKKSYDLIIVSDMLNLPLFKSLCYKKIKKTKIVIYFHESQISYPRSIFDQDIKNKRDLHYTFINYSSSLVSDYNLFNSQYHFNDYFLGISNYLKKMPDNKNFDSIEVIKKKSSILHIGSNIKKFNNNKLKKNKFPVVLWNHRWEHDKNPELFFDVLYKIYNKKIKFNLIVLGEKFNFYPDCFNSAIKKLNDLIIHVGFCKSKKEYEYWLLKADVLPVTSHQDFFGLSVIEAVSAYTYPILPNRLSYPEIFDKKNNPEIFYNSKNELYCKLSSYLNDYKILRYSSSKYKDLVSRFDWSTMVDKYDKKFEEIYNY